MHANILRFQTVKQIMALKDITTQNPEPAPKDHILLKKRLIEG